MGNGCSNVERTRKLTQVETPLDLKEIEKHYAATIDGFSSNPGIYYESSKDVPALLRALREHRAALRWALPFAEAQIGRDPTVYPAVLGGLHQARTVLESVVDV